MTTFAYSPMPGATQEQQPRVRAAQFGDGYQQRVGDGINTMPRKWPLQFTRATADIDAIETFLVARAGVESFDWTPPAGAAGKWICKAWSRIVHKDTVQGINATFEEVFGD
jgi:phage-related protein